MSNGITRGTTALGMLLVGGLTLGAGAAGAQPVRRAPRIDVRSPAMPYRGFVVTSADVRDGGTFTKQQESDTFGCNGPNASPALAWRGAPTGTRSFAVTMYDPDAPTGSGFWHWVVYNIPTNITTLAAGAGSKGGTMPPGAVQATTDYGATGYGGACPPPGDGPHRYIITVHALRTDRVEIPAGATAAVVGYTLHAQTLATASLTARYAR